MIWFDYGIGTNFYKYFYALAQRIQTNEIKTSEIFLKLQDYFKYTNIQGINLRDKYYINKYNYNYVEDIKKGIRKIKERHTIPDELCEIDPLACREYDV